MQSDPNGNDVLGSTTMVTAAVSQPVKVFHNTRCTRHLKPRHTTHSGAGPGVAAGIASDSSGSQQQRDREHHHQHHFYHMHNNSHSHPHGHSHGLRCKSESVLSTDSDIRFTRRKLGDSQKCGCAVIAGFLIALLVAGVFVYVGCK